MSVLSIAQDASIETTVYGSPSSLIGDTNPGETQLLRHIYKVMRYLRRIYPWEILRAEASFTTVPLEEQNGVMDASLDYILTDSFWNRTDNAQVKPTTVLDWNQKLSDSYSDQSNPLFIRRGGELQMQPIPNAGDSCYFEWITKKSIDIAAGGTTKEAFTLDTDVILIDEELITYGVIFELLNSEGLPALVAAEAYKDYFETMVSNEGGNPDGILSVGDLFEATYFDISTLGA